MKKYVAMLLAAMLVGSFAACTPKTTDEPVVDEPETETEAETEVEEEPVEEETVEEEEPAEEKTELVMATNASFKPYEYYEGSEIVGIDAEIAAAIAEKMGLTLRIEDMEFSSIISAVDAGSVDMGMAGMTVTEDRKKSVDFSYSYANGVQSVIVKEGSEVDLDTLGAEGSEQKIGVQLGTTGDIYATDEFGSDRVLQYSNANEAVLALVGGDIDCVIIDNQPAKALVAENEGLTILDTSYADEDYAICVKKGNTELLDQINAAIDELVADGTIDEILLKYIH